jgi:integrase
MVHRAELTPKLVFEIECPKTGELWVADTKIRGFGLRLWSTASGGQKAFAIRTANSKGKIIRRTFDADQAWRTKFDFAYGDRRNNFGLGEYLEEARDWARDEVDQLKGSLTAAERAWLEHSAVGRLVKSLPLERAAASLLRGLQVNGISQKYLDRLDKLFENNIPNTLKKTPLGKLKPKEVARILVRSRLSAGNLRALRSFVSQILERGASFHGPLGRFHDEFSAAFSVQWERVRKVRYPELNKLPDKKYQQLFKILESEPRHWQQAFAIRLYFEFGAPLSRILSARWNQIYEQYWYPYSPDEKEFWLECRENIDGDAKRLLNHIRTLCMTKGNKNGFWFPSTFSHSQGHIRSVEHVWRLAIRQCGLSYYPLREFSRSYREFNNPSYYVSFLRQYKPLLDKARNVAELSKLVSSQRNNIDISNN